MGSNAACCTRRVCSLGMQITSISDGGSKEEPAPLADSPAGQSAHRGLMPVQQTRGRLHAAMVAQQQLYKTAW